MSEELTKKVNRLEKRLEKVSGLLDEKIIPLLEEIKSEIEELPDSEEEEEEEDEDEVEDEDDDEDEVEDDDDDEDESEDEDDEEEEEDNDEEEEEGFTCPFCDKWDADYDKIVKHIEKCKKNPENVPKKDKPKTAKKTVFKPTKKYGKNKYKLASEHKTAKAAEKKVAKHKKKGLKAKVLEKDGQFAVYTFGKAKK